MRALITGASSGIGLEFAKELSRLGYDLILVSRDKEKLNELSQKFKTNVEVIALDLSTEENAKKLYDKTKGRVDFLINNAGFGIYGKFIDTSLAEELNMIELNLKTYHILTKLFLTEMVNKNSGRILNVASAAAFQPGPLLSTYYSTKAYIYSLSAAIYEELRRMKSGVKISVLCPGPVNTEFNKRAKTKFNMPALEVDEVVKYALNKVYKNKLIIIPGLLTRIAVFINRVVSRKFMLKISYMIQNKKKR